MHEETNNRKIIWSAIGILAVATVLFTAFFFMVNQASRETNLEVVGTDEYTTPSKYENIQIKTHEEREDEQRYFLHISWPVTENEKINADLDRLAEEFIDEYAVRSGEIKEARAEYINETGEDGATFHANYSQHFDVSFADENYVAFVFNQSRNTGNTGTEDTFSKIYDRNTGEEIMLASLFAGEDYLETLSEISRRELRRQVEEEAREIDFDSPLDRERWLESREKMLLDGTEPIAENFESVVINEEGNLVISFDKYQVAPGYLGVANVFVPAAEIINGFSPAVQQLLDLARGQREEEVPEAETPPAVVPENEIPVNGSAREGDIDCAVQKCIALTFDDGPSVYTDRLLDILVEKDARATFFVLGVNARVQQSTLQRTASLGMEIGNHSWSHPDLTKLSEADIKNQIDSASDLIQTVTGVRPSIVRPPYGAYDERVIASVGVPLIMWNIDPADWQFRDSEHVTAHIINHARSGAIVLLHDIHQSTVEAMPTVIDTLRREGYVFATVSELIGYDNLVPGRAYRSRW